MILKNKTTVWKICLFPDGCFLLSYIRKTEIDGYNRNSIFLMKIKSHYNIITVVNIKYTQIY